MLQRIKKMKQDIIDYEGFEDCDEAEYRKLAQLWLDFGLKRKYVKRPVMTSLYSATLYGFTNQIMKDTIIPLRFASLPYGICMTKALACKRSFIMSKHL